MTLFGDSDRPLLQRTLAAGLADDLVEVNLIRAAGVFLDKWHHADELLLGQELALRFFAAGPGVFQIAHK